MTAERRLAAILAVDVGAREIGVLPRLMSPMVEPVGGLATRLAFEGQRAKICQVVVPTTQKPLPNGSLQNAMGGRAPPSNFCSHFAPAFTAFARKASNSST